MTNIIIDCGGKCGNCCNEVELVSTHKLEDGTVRRFYSDGTSDIYNPGVPLENPTTGGGSGTTYNDTAIKERLTKLENKQDKDTTYTAGTGISISADNVISATSGGSTYDDTEIKERIQALEFRPDLDTVYTAGTGITISPDNVISTNVTSYDDTDLKALAEANQAVNNDQDENILALRKTTDLLDSEQASLNDRISALESRPSGGESSSASYYLDQDIVIEDPKKISELGTVEKFPSFLLNNAISISLPDTQKHFNNIVLQLPEINFDFTLNGTPDNYSLNNIVTEDSWIFTGDSMSGRGHIYVKFYFGVLKMEYDISSSMTVVDFEFEFFKLSKYEYADGGVAVKFDAQEPSLTVPLTIDNILNGEPFGANFYDEYTVSVTLEEPMIGLNAMQYVLKNQ